MPEIDARLDDEFEDREQRFLHQQSISERAYSELLDMASGHAAAATALPGAPPWRFVGPRNLGGRIIAIDQSPDDPRILYVGSAYGGLWRSIDAGDTWERLGDRTHVFPVGTIAVAPKAPNTIYFGTGAHLPTYVSGKGLFRAQVTGPALPATIECLVAPDPVTKSPRDASPGAAPRYTRLRVDPDDPARFWAASQTGLWRCECPLTGPLAPQFRRDFPNKDNEPAAAALVKKLPANGLWPAHCTDLLVSHDPRETATVRLNKHEVPRYLILFVAIDKVGVFRGRFDRSDGSVSFESSPRDMPTTGINFSRIRLAQCERQPKHVYAVMADQPADVASEVFHSDDSGDGWTKGPQRLGAVDTLRGQASYDLFLEVAPDDPRVVVCGEVEVALSTNFGRTWALILDWNQFDRGDKAQHADQHIAMFDRGDHRRIWIGNDGGLTMARDLRLPAQAYGYWRKRSHGIYAGQCQDVSVNPALPFMCAAGLQDNGTWLSLGGPTWYHCDGADGGGAAFNLPNPRQFVATWQGGIDRVDAVAADAPTTPAVYNVVSHAAGDLPDNVARGHRVRYGSTQLDLPPSGIAGGSPFIGVLEQHPTVPNQLLAGRVGDASGSTNLGAAWAPLMGAPMAPGGEVCALAFGPADPRNPLAPNVDGWAGTSLGSLFFTNNAPVGVWAAVPTALPFPGAAQRVTEIVAHPLDRRIVAVSVTGIYGRVFLSYDQGRRWLDLTEPTPTSLVVNPAGASVQVGQTRPFTAIASYPGPTVVNVTARAAWSSRNVVQATVGTAQQTGSAVWGPGTEGDMSGFLAEGFVTGVGAGTPTITATLIAGVPNGSASQPVTVTAAAVAALPLASQPRENVPGSLPPGPVSSVIFDPAPAAGAAATLLAGTLAGVYALPNVPVVASLAIQPAGPLAFQTGAAPFQFRCVATFTDGTQVDVTRDVDWSTNAAGTATVSNVAPHGQLTFGAIGAATITVDRGGRSTALIVNVQAAAAPAPPAPPAAPAAVNPIVTVAWALFNNGLPQVLVTDFERVGTTNAIRAATFGLGIFECITSGAPIQQLYIRQTLVEDGRYPPAPAPARPAAPPLPDDPRVPAGVVALDYTHAFDIRVDAPPYAFFDDVVDGVEFDEQLEVGDPVPTEDNYVYVQVHNSGTTAVPNVSVHLYAAECAAGDVVNPIGAAATALPASLDAGAPIADFYGQPNFDPIAASRWKRVDVVRVLDDVPPDSPRVARFTWAPDAALATKSVALLALCSGHPLSLDALPAAPAAVTLSALIPAERRAALRIVHVAPRPAAALYLRDGVAADARIGGYPVAGRSPDIMVVHPDIGGPPEDAFKDFIARRPTDTVTGTGKNIIYVRVHNRRRFETKAKVKVYAIHLNDSSAPDPVTANWTELPSAAAFADVTVPASGVGYARVEFPNPGDPNAAGLGKAYLLLALIRSEDDTDPLPNKDRVATADDFWDLVSHYVDADNAAARAVPWVP